jgi:hypothetical protein
VTRPKFAARSLPANSARMAELASMWRNGAATSTAILDCAATHRPLIEAFFGEHIIPILAADGSRMAPEEILRVIRSRCDETIARMSPRRSSSPRGSAS